MKRSALFILCFGIGLSWLVYSVHKVSTATDLGQALENFHDHTVQVHWVTPVNRQVSVLLEEWAVTGTDSACDAVLSMLDRLTHLIPRTWMVRLISPSGWVPSTVNPLNREDVVAMKDDKVVEVKLLHKSEYWDSGRPGSEVNE